MKGNKMLKKYWNTRIEFDLHFAMLRKIGTGIYDAGRFIV
jgi:hypothetical protein